MYIHEFWYSGILRADLYFIFIHDIVLYGHIIIYRYTVRLLIRVKHVYIILYTPLRQRLAKGSNFALRFPTCNFVFDSSTDADKI